MGDAIKNQVLRRSLGYMYYDDGTHHWSSVFATPGKGFSGVAARIGPTISAKVDNT